MTDLIHLLILLLSLMLIGVGLWLITPAAMFVGVGLILLAIVWSARNVKEMRNARDSDESQ